MAKKNAKCRIIDWLNPLRQENAVYKERIAETQVQLVEQQELNSKINQELHKKNQELNIDNERLKSTASLSKVETNPKDQRQSQSSTNCMSAQTNLNPITHRGTNTTNASASATPSSKRSSTANNPGTTKIITTHSPQQNFIYGHGFPPAT